LKIKLQKTTEDGRMPIKGTADAACYDVYAHSITISNDGKVNVGLGFKTEIPRGYKGIIVPRSNLTKFHWVLNNSYGVIDSDYRGEWMAIFTPVPPVVNGQAVGTAFPYNIGERVAQIFFEKVEIVQFIEVESLDDSSRGEGGFGSTGLNYVTNTTADVKINTIN
jgi:dUTP pyrophosphatase